MPCNFHVFQPLCFPDLPTAALLPSAFHPPFHLLCTLQPLCFSAAPGFSWDRLVISSSFLTHPFPWLHHSHWGAVWVVAVSINNSRAVVQQWQFPAHGELQGNEAIPHPTAPQSVSSQGLSHPINHNTLQNLLCSRDGVHQEPISTVDHLSLLTTIQLGNVIFLLPAIVQLLHTALNSTGLTPVLDGGTAA